MPSASPDPDRQYLVFGGTFPSEGEWIGDDPDPNNPPGREVINVLLKSVDPSLPESELWVEEEYGWSFNCKVEDVTVNVLVQFVDHWLVIVQEVSFKPRFLRGAKYRAAVLEVAQRIHRALQSDPRARNLSWTTATEYIELARGNRLGV